MLRHSLSKARQERVQQFAGEENSISFRLPEFKDNFILPAHECNKFEKFEQTRKF
jgi:hypothetical protein